MSLLKFRPKTSPVTAGAAGETAPVKFGLYPLGADEVLMSTPTFEVIVHLLTTGTPEDRQELASMLRRMYQAPFAGPSAPAV